MKTSKLILFALASCSALSVCVGCASNKVEPLTSAAVQPVAVEEVSMRGNLMFYKKASYISAAEKEGAQAGNAAGGGLLGKVVAGVASGALKKAQQDMHPELYTEALAEQLHVQDILMEELVKFPEVQQLIPADDVLNEKAYAKLKSDSSVYRRPVGAFKYFGGDEKEREKRVASARKILKQKFGANGYAEIIVDFGTHLEEQKTELQEKLQKVENVLSKITFQKAENIGKDTGFLYPYVSVMVRIYDENGTALPFPYRYENGTQIKGYTTAKEAKKDESYFTMEDYYYFGSAVGSECVNINSGEYNAEEFYKLYTEDLVRKAVQNAALR